MNAINDGGPAFPELGRGGMSLRDYFAIHAPAPTVSEIKTVSDREQMANPHNDAHKPIRHSAREIECGLRYQYADAMLKARANASER